LKLLKPESNADSMVLGLGGGARRWQEELVRRTVLLQPINCVQGHVSKHAPPSQCFEMPASRTPQHWRTGILPTANSLSTHMSQLEHVCIEPAGAQAV
jgi:hypothetical protein